MNKLAYLVSNAIVGGFDTDEERRAAQRQVRGKYRRWFRRQFKRALKDPTAPMPNEFSRGHVKEAPHE